MASELGILLKEMIDILNVRRRPAEKKGATMAYLGDELGYSTDAIFRWRQGRHKPNTKTLEQLIEIGVSEAGMSKRWAERVLHHGEHPNPGHILRRYFPSADNVRHNLLHRTYYSLVGRETEFAEVIRRLSPEERHWLVAIEGVGGVGKSALAQEVGWHFIENYTKLPPGRRFEAIVWVSAKRNIITLRGIEQVISHMTNLDDLFQTIADVLEYPNILQVARRDQPREVEKALRQAGRVLLIVDNLETVDDPQLRAFLRDLPSPTKAIATTRYHEDMPFPIRLKELNLSAARELTVQECKTRGIMLTKDQIDRLLEYTEGLPLAIWLAVGLMMMEGYGVKKVLTKLRDPEQPLLHFIFGEVVNQLKTSYRDAYYTLLALSFFDLDTGAGLIPLSIMTDLDPEICREAVHQLLNTNLIYRARSEDHFAMLPITRQYAWAKMAQEPSFDAQAFDRWVDWVAHSKAVHTEHIKGDDKMYQETLKLVSQAKERIWLLLTSAHEISLEQEVEWLQNGHRINGHTPFSSKERLQNRIRFFKRLIQQHNYYKRMIAKAQQAQEFGDKFEYTRVVQCPDGRITTDNVGYHYLKHMQDMLTASESLKDQENLLIRVLLYEAQPLRNKSFAIVDNRYIFIQENKEINGRPYMYGIRVIYDPPPEVLKAFESIFEDVRDKSIPAPVTRIQQECAELPNAVEALREPVNNIFRDLLADDNQWHSETKVLAEQMFNNSDVEIQQLLAETLKALLQDRSLHQVTEKLIAELKHTNPEFSVWYQTNGIN